MYFDYHDWRCQLRDKKVTLNYGVNLRGMKIIRHTEFWFYHFCDHPNKKPNGKTESKPPWREKTRHQHPQGRGQSPVHCSVVPDLWQGDALVSKGLLCKGM